MSVNSILHPRAGMAVLALLLLLPLPGLQAQQEQNVVAAGARVYGDMCGRCHRPRSPLERTDRDWVTIVNHMRVRANLTGKQVRAVLDFLQATNSSPSERAPLPGGAPAGRQITEFSNQVSSESSVIARGKEIVGQRACLGCHQLGSEGGQVGPSLNGVVGRRTAAFVRHKMADPTFNNATSMMPNFALSADEIDAIAAYLNTLNGGK
ncbi:MAG: c-type cytochrome [Gemmatimonadetes bacterium]|nr:c-type cytochrome [Gemmatimonadota bacterium]